MGHEWEGCSCPSDEVDGYLAEVALVIGGFCVLCALILFVAFG